MANNRNRDTLLAGMKLLLWVMSRQRGWKWMSLSFLGYVGILYGVFVVGGFMLLTHDQISRGFLGFHGGGVAIGLMIGTAFWPVASVLQGVLHRRCWRVIADVEASHPEPAFDPGLFGQLFVWSMALGVFCAYVPASRGLYAPFQPVLLTLLCLVVLLLCARCGRALAQGSDRLLAAQAGAGGMPNSVGREAVVTGAGVERLPAGGGQTSTAEPVLGEGHQAERTAGLPKIAIVDWKALLIFAVVALLTTVVVGFSLLLTPFG